MYPAGTYFIPFAQPKRGVVKTLLERTFWPDDSWTRQKDGSPSRPYDTVTDTMAEMMGVHVDPVPVSHQNLTDGKGFFIGTSSCLTISRVRNWYVRRPARCALATGFDETLERLHV